MVYEDLLLVKKKEKTEKNENEKKKANTKSVIRI